MPTTVVFDKFRFRMTNDAKSVRKPLVLFVHGLGGDSAASWGLFPHLIQHDPVLTHQVDVAYYEYPTDFFRWPFRRQSVRIQDLGTSIRTEMDVRYREYQDVILICHSMGGIISQKYIIEEIKDKRTLRIKGILLYAVPNSGAALANWGTLISWRHWQLKQLRKDSDLLESIRNDWKDWDCGDKLKVTRVFGGQDSIVPMFETSSPEDKYLPYNDHINIIKPKTREESSYLIFRQFVTDVVNLQDSDRIPSQQTELNTYRPPALFDIYRPEYERFYIQRREDLIVNGYLSMQNVWLYGPSGYGKTAALMRALNRSGKYRLISLGHYLGSDSRQLFCAIYESLLAPDQPRVDAESLSWPDLIAAIVSLLEPIWLSGVKWILIEEMPLSDALGLKEFFSKLCSLLMLYAQLNSSRPISFAFSSVNDPRVGLDGIQRMAELLKVVRFGEWRRGDVVALRDLLIREAVPDLGSDNADKLLLEGNGSPRFLKLFCCNFLNVKALFPEPQVAFEEALAATRLEMPT